MAIIPKRKSRRRKEPLEVELSVSFNFGDKPEDAVTVIDQQKIPMVDSVFESRDRILKGFAGLLIRTGLRQPKVAGELLSISRLLRKKHK